MADRDLLTLAAKAAGIEMQWDTWANPPMVLSENGIDTSTWNPLTDDGDALRLVVKLGIPFHVFYEHKSVIAYSKKTNLHPEGFDAQEFFTEFDELTATRRAIVRAAAEIGKAMEGGQHGTE